MGDPDTDAGRGGHLMGTKNDQAPTQGARVLIQFDEGPHHPHRDDASLYQQHPEALTPVTTHSEEPRAVNATPTPTPTPMPTPPPTPATSSGTTGQLRLQKTTRWQRGGKNRGVQRRREVEKMRSARRSGSPLGNSIGRKTNIKAVDAQDLIATNQNSGQDHERLVMPP
ncbi:hypothetical protein BDZ91DRAFT_767342 [Kalaharituber pfeilii]|nr:hypothetical protein BDZ91DRAFT_767342 [Kalaharituber pfeilii]